MTIGGDAGDDAQRFTALYREHHLRVRDFAQRRVGTDLAQEVVAETFLVAWRRLDDIPGVAIPWLFRVALYEIANLRRRQAKAGVTEGVGRWAPLYFGSETVLLEEISFCTPKPTLLGPS